MNSYTRRTLCALIFACLTSNQLIAMHTISTKSSKETRLTSSLLNKITLPNHGNVTTVIKEIKEFDEHTLSDLPKEKSLITFKSFTQSRPTIARKIVESDSDDSDGEKETKKMKRSVIVGALGIIGSLLITDQVIEAKEKRSVEDPKPTEKKDDPNTIKLTPEQQKKMQENAPKDKKSQKLSQNSAPVEQDQPKKNAWDKMTGVAGNIFQSLYGGFVKHMIDSNVDQQVRQQYKESLKSPSDKEREAKELYAKGLQDIEDHNNKLQKQSEELHKEERALSEELYIKQLQKEYEDRLKSNKTNISKEEPKTLNDIKEKITTTLESEQKDSSNVEVGLKIEQVAGKNTDTILPSLSQQANLVSIGLGMISDPDSNTTKKIGETLEAVDKVADKVIPFDPSIEFQKQVIKEGTKKTISILGDEIITPVIKVARETIYKKFIEDDGQTALERKAEPAKFGQLETKLQDKQELLKMNLLTESNIPQAVELKKEIRKIIEKDLKPYKRKWNPWTKQIELEDEYVYEEYLKHDKKAKLDAKHNILTQDGKKYRVTVDQQSNSFVLTELTPEDIDALHNPKPKKFIVSDYNDLVDQELNKVIEDDNNNSGIFATITYPFRYPFYTKYEPKKRNSFTEQDKSTINDTHQRSEKEIQHRNNFTNSTLIMWAKTRDYEIDSYNDIDSDGELVFSKIDRTGNRKYIVFDRKGTSGGTWKVYGGKKRTETNWYFWK